MLMYKSCTRRFFYARYDVFCVRKGHPGAAAAPCGALRSNGAHPIVTGRAGKKGGPTAPRIPTWSPTVVLTRP